MQQADSGFLIMTVRPNHCRSVCCTNSTCLQSYGLEDKHASEGTQQIQHE